MTDPHVPMGERLQKVLARNGVGNRRACEGLIVQGRVSVDGYAVRELGTRVDPVASVIHIDGIRVQTDSSFLTLVLYKPPGIVSTMHDDMGRPGLVQYVEDRPERLYHVGRFDQGAEGLILLSNDGELMYRLTHPKYEVPKIYIVRVEGPATRGLGRVLERGITLEDGPVRVDRFILRESVLRNSIVEITLHSDRNRIMHRMMAEVGHPVTELVRMKFGTITVGHPEPGKIRVVAGGEFGALMKLVDL